MDNAVKVFLSLEGEQSQLTVSGQLELLKALLEVLRDSRPREIQGRTCRTEEEEGK